VKRGRGEETFFMLLTSPELNGSCNEILKAIQVAAER
jgi:hypothetical protein